MTQNVATLLSGLSHETSLASYLNGLRVGIRVRSTCSFHLPLHETRFPIPTEKRKLGVADWYSETNWQSADLRIFAREGSFALVSQGVVHRCLSGFFPAGLRPPVVSVTRSILNGLNLLFVRSPSLAQLCPFPPLVPFTLAFPSSLHGTCLSR